MKFLKPEYRPTFQIPAGKIVDTQTGVNLCLGHLKTNSLLICVGDQTTFNLLDNGIIAQISIVDGLTKRKEFDADKLNNIRKNYSQINMCNNPAGAINPLAMQSVKNAIDTYDLQKTKTLIVVDGEEDLLFIPSVIFSPESSMIVYGQPNEGMVVCVADKTLKKRMSELLEIAFEER